jgi:hypothetical protein
MIDTTARYNQAVSLVAGRKLWDVQSLSELFTDHENHPASICRHVNKSDPEFLHNDRGIVYHGSGRRKDAGYLRATL